ncbi:hypothetical protein [Vibrio comitans]|uniref:Carboxymuconolactone decarboxylase-like domain-containing protein n=1 Tax=Vibrio comitans NBRC 102076 TaxID=1219078 RepID=A0A4Y3IK74_9VIBR|nr:hypothetical protein [Vibrio comitans]GEA59338.1 hypothetical protein VCO01S_05310 [Vibrio comitans NBRC 102076]
MRLSNIQQKLGTIYSDLLKACDDPVSATYVALEISKQNGCSYCIDMHSEELAKFSEKEITELNKDQLNAVIEGVVRCKTIDADNYDVALIEYAILINTFNRVGKLA